MSKRPATPFQATSLRPASRVAAHHALELYQRGESFAAIGRTLQVHHTTAAKYVRDQQALALDDTPTNTTSLIAEAIDRFQCVIRQAWADHDADELRELEALNAAATGKLTSLRYQSQRAQYLRTIVEAQREIARLHGLYADAGHKPPDDVTLTIVRLSAPPPRPEDDS